MLVRNPSATFLYRADGWSIIGAGICGSDILVVDRSVTPLAGDLVIAVWDGDPPTCKVLKAFEHHLELQSANPEFPPIVLDQGTEVEVPIKPQPVTCQQRKAQAARRAASLRLEQLFDPDPARRNDEHGDDRPVLPQLHANEQDEYINANHIYQQHHRQQLRIGQEQEHRGEANQGAPPEI